MKRCFGVLASLALALFGAPGQAEPKPDGSLTLLGAYPEDVRPLPGGAIAFIAYAEDGNRRTVHVLDGAVLRRSTTLPPGRRLAELSDTMIVTGERGFDVYDAETAALLKHKQFEKFSPPYASADSHWLEGDVLTIMQNNGNYDRNTTLRRIRLPQLEVIERSEAPVFGAFVRWKDRIVAVGYLHESNGQPRPSITVLDSGFHVLAHGDIDPSTRCGFAGFARPLVTGDLLIYGSDCGGIRVYDLQNMRQIAARGPLGAAQSVYFTLVAGRLLATSFDQESATIDEIELPSLRPTRLLRISGDRFAVSGPNLYAFRDPADESPRPRARKFTVDVYSTAGRKAERSLSESVIDAQRAALLALQDSNDVPAAIATMRPAIPQLGSADVASLTPAAMRAVAWYAGLLALANEAKDAASLVASLRAAAPDDAQIHALADAAMAWLATVTPPNTAATIPTLKSTFTPGALSGVIARTPDHLIAARWCGTADIIKEQRTPTPRAEPDTAATALAACFKGEVGLAIHDPRNLRFQRYIPVINSEDIDQEFVDAILTFGDIAVVSIGRRYEDESLDSLVTVDVDTGAVLARSKRVLQTDPAPTQAIGCLKGSCDELDPKTLKPGTSPLADSVALESGPAETSVVPQGSPYAFALRLWLLEARDRDSNGFVCAWPVAHPDGDGQLFHNPQDNTLVLEGNPDSPDDLTPSITIDVPTLIGRAQDCGINTAKYKAALDLAMRTLQ